MNTAAEVSAAAPLAPPALHATPPTTVTTFVAIESELVVRNRQLLKQRVVDLIAEGKRDFTLDFAKCPYVDSAGAGVLVSIAKKVSDANGSLVLVNVNDDVTRYFEFTRLDTLFTVRRA